MRSDSRTTQAQHNRGICTRGHAQLSICNVANSSNRWAKSVTNNLQGLTVLDRSVLQELAGLLLAHEAHAATPLCLQLAYQRTYSAPGGTGLAADIATPSRYRLRKHTLGKSCVT